MTFGSKDLAAASDGELLRLGKVVCDGLGIEGPGVRSGRPATGAVGGTPDDLRRHGLGQERGAQPLPSACQRHPLTWRRYTPGTRGTGRQGRATGTSGHDWF
jgi:hypothetical protein